MRREKKIKRVRMTLHNVVACAMALRTIADGSEIASRATKRKICEFVGAAVLLRDDVVDMESRKRQSRLRQAAVFTAITGSLPHLDLQLLVHQTDVVRARTARAFA